MSAGTCERSRRCSSLLISGKGCVSGLTHHASAVIRGVSADAVGKAFHNSSFPLKRFSHAKPRRTRKKSWKPFFSATPRRGEKHTVDLMLRLNEATENQLEMKKASLYLLLIFCVAFRHAVLSLRELIPGQNFLIFFSRPSQLPVSRLVFPANRSMLRRPHLFSGVGHFAQEESPPS